MVAKITISKSIEAALNYNEKKVQKGTAQCLHAANYLGEAKDMNFYQKLKGFENLNNLNKRASTKTVHVSLNFDPSEKLSNEKLIEIANMYMENIGFGEQPFLIYKHHDAGHPHIHIVSTTIKEDGSRINTHNIGRNQSEKARKEIEDLYGLKKAERQQQIVNPGIKPLNIEKVIYGKSETKRSISNIVGAVFSQYKFSSLPEFNAALKQFNVIADRGKEEGVIYKNRGLVYRILDADESKIGVPIKASSISCRPTLDNLEKKFIANETAKQTLKLRTKSTIDDCVHSGTGGMKNLISFLDSKQIYTVLRQNAEGRLYGITFVDNQNKCVFNGSDLGKGYSATALQSKFANDQQEQKINIPVQEKQSDSSTPTMGKKMIVQRDKKEFLKTEHPLKDLLSVKEQHQNVPFQLVKKKRKKKKRDLGL